MLLRSKLGLLLTPLLLIPVGIVAWIAYELLADHIIERSEQEARNLLAREVQNFSRLKTHSIASLRLLEAYSVLQQYLLTNDEDLRYNLLQPSLLETFATYQEQYPHFNEIRVILPDGFEDVRRTIGFVPNATEQEAQSAFFATWQELDANQVSNSIQVNPDDGEIVLLLGKKLMLTYRGLDPVHAKPMLRGYLGITVGLKAYAEQVEARRFGHTGRLLLTDRRGQPVRIDGNSLLMSELEDIHFDSVTSSESSMTRFHGERLVYWRQPIQDDLFLIAVQSEDELLAPTRALAWSVVLVSLVATLTLMVSIYLTMQRLIINRLSKLNEAAQAITAGDLGTQINHGSEDEIGKLSASFHEMQQSLLRSQTEVQRYQRELEQKITQAQSASKAKSDFLAKMSHEIRTPMNGVIVSLELLLGSGLTERQYRFAKLASDSATGLLDIINDILDFSKIEVGRLELAHKAFNLHDEVVKPAVDMLIERARLKGLTLDTQLDKDLVLELQGDPLRLRQIVVNLLGNAVKFTDQGHVILRIWPLAQDQHSTLLHFVIEDTGIGLFPEEINGIFDSFTQADNSYSRRYGGTGLGLSIAKQLVELMHGRIGVESKPGEGAKFWFELRLDKQVGRSPGPLGLLRDPHHAIPSPTSGMRVLLAEDNPISLEVGQEMLHALDCDVVTCVNGQQVLDALADNSYDLVLMDCQMPVMDGYQATRELRQREAKTGQTRTPVIAVTANAFASDKQSALDVGMDDYLSKPYKQEDLQELLLRWKSRSRIGHMVD
jgi:signal transduction histidine kinase/CheY-like chemotaxis protein